VKSQKGGSGRNANKQKFARSCGAVLLLCTLCVVSAPGWCGAGWEGGLGGMTGGRVRSASLGEAGTAVHVWRSAGHVEDVREKREGRRVLASSR
jgi:hypothetical protein